MTQQKKKIGVTQLIFIVAALLGVALDANAQTRPEREAAEAVARVPPKLVIGYHPNARPFSFDTEPGKPSGYAVEVCARVAELAKAELDLARVELTWAPVSPEGGRAALREGKVNLLCGEPVTLAARKEVSFSIPIFQGGVGALVRTDAPPELVSALPERPTPSAVKDLDEGVRAVVERKAGVFFAERSILLDAVKRNPSSAELKVIDRPLTLAPIAIALPRGNENARLAVDRVLSKLYGTPEFRAAYARWFGEPDADTAAFFRLSALPE